ETRLAVVLDNVTLDAKRREVDRQRIQREQCLARRAVVLRRVVVRIPREVDVVTGEVHRVRHVHRDAADADAERAGRAEGIEHVAAATDRVQRLEYVDVELEGADEAGELRGDAAVALAAAEA